MHKSCSRHSRELLFYNIFNLMEIFFFARDLFADIMSMHNRNMKHTCTIEFD